MCLQSTVSIPVISVQHLIDPSLAFVFNNPALVRGGSIAPVEGWRLHSPPKRSFSVQGRKFYRYRCCHICINCLEQLRSCLGLHFKFIPFPCFHSRNSHPIPPPPVSMRVLPCTLPLPPTSPTLGHGAFT